MYTVCVFFPVLDVFVCSCAFFVIKYGSTDIFIRLDIYMELRVISCGVNILFCSESMFFRFLSAKTYTLFGKYFAEKLVQN